MLFKILPFSGISTALYRQQRLLSFNPLFQPLTTPSLTKILATAVSFSTSLQRDSQLSTLQSLPAISHSGQVKVKCWCRDGDNSEQKGGNLPCVISGVVFQSFGVVMIRSLLEGREWSCNYEYSGIPRRCSGFLDIAKMVPDVDVEWRRRMISMSGPCNPACPQLLHPRTRKL